MTRRRLGLLIVAVYLVAASGMGAATAYVLHARSVASSQSTIADVLHMEAGPAVPVDPQLLVPRKKTAKYLVLMVLDGARPDYFDSTSLPHFDALRRSGAQFTNAMDGILEAETPAGHAAIATGSRPDRDGILGFDWGNDNDSGSYSLFAPQQMGALETILRDANAPTIAQLYKQRYPGSMVVALSGHKYYAAAPLGGPSADAILYYEGDPKGRYVPVAVPGHVPPSGVLNAPGLIYPTTRLKDGVEDDLVTKLALATVSKMHPRLLLMNYPEFDWPLGHVYGGNLDRAKVIADMKGWDVGLGKIEDAYRKAGILGQTLFVVTSDHGMMPIKRFVPASEIEQAVTAAGTSAPDIATNSADYIWLADSAKAPTVAENIVSRRDPGIQAVYYLSSAGAVPHYVLAPGVNLHTALDSANQYLLSALLNGHQPTVVVFGQEGTSFTDSSTHWKADHGGASWESQHIPLILSGPGVRAGTVSAAPAQLEDIAPTVLTDMGVTPTGMEGHVLTEALRVTSPLGQQSRKAEVDQLSPVAQALMASSTGR